MIKLKFNIRKAVYTIVLLYLFCGSIYSQTVDLSTYTATAPQGSVLQWHNSATPSSATLLSSTVVTATSTPTNYWGFFYDAANDCYSPGSYVVVVANTCPSNTVNLNAMTIQTPPTGTVFQWHTSDTPSSSTLVANPNAVGAGTYYGVFYDASNNCYSPTSPVEVAIQQCYCYKPAITTGTTLDTNHGITALGRAGDDNSNWPMVRKGAWTVLESKTKGFVVNRLTDAQVAAIPSTDLREGMMVYNITQDCLQINVDGTSTGWKCFTTQTCPD